MSTQSSTDVELFYEFLGRALDHGSRDTPPEALLRSWRAQREFEQTCEDIRHEMAEMQVDLGRPAEEVFAELRHEFGFDDGP